jgi:hypothetical protein
MRTAGGADGGDADGGDADGGDADGAAGSTSHAPFGQKNLSDYGEEGR